MELYFYPSPSLEEGWQYPVQKTTYIAKSALLFLFVLCTLHLEHRFALPPFFRLSPKQQSDLLA